MPRHPSKFSTWKTQAIHRLIEIDGKQTDPAIKNAILKTILTINNAKRRDFPGVLRRLYELVNLYRLDEVREVIPDKDKLMELLTEA